MNGGEIVLGLPSGPLCALLLVGGLLDVRDLGRLAMAVGATTFRARVLLELAAAHGALVATRVLSAAELGTLARWSLRVHLLETHVVANNVWGGETEEWRLNGQRHREDGRPAQIWRRADGSVEREAWWQNGQQRRDGDRPAVITYCADGSVSLEAWYQSGQRHRDGDRPAWIVYRANGRVVYEEWYQNGQLHRDHDHPAVVWCCANASVDREEWLVAERAAAPRRRPPGFDLAPPRRKSGARRVAPQRAAAPRRRPPGGDCVPCRRRPRGTRSMYGTRPGSGTAPPATARRGLRTTPTEVWKTRSGGRTGSGTATATGRR